MIYQWVMSHGNIGLLQGYQSTYVLYLIAGSIPTLDHAGLTLTLQGGNH